MKSVMACPLRGRGASSAEPVLRMGKRLSEGHLTDMWRVLCPGQGLSPVLRSFSGLWNLETGLPSLISFSRKPSAHCEVCTAFLSWRSGAAAPSLGVALVRCSSSWGDAGSRVGAHADPVDSAGEAGSAAFNQCMPCLCWEERI